MLDKIIKFSLNNKFFIIVCYLVLTIAGIYSARQMDIDVFPDLTAPTVVVMTDCHGMASEEVEKLVTYPIETAVNGAVGVRRVRSSSSQGFSFVWVEFDWGEDIFRARQIVSEKLATINAQMPDGIGQPTLAPQSSVMGEIFFVSLQADSTSMLDLRTLADWTLKPLILATGGVSQVTVIGGDHKQYQILADPQRMGYYGVSTGELIEACKSINDNSSGNVVRQYGNEYVVRGIARTSDLNELGNTYIKSMNGKPIRINDVAEVKIGASTKMGHAAENAKPSVVLSISKQPNINTLNVTKAIEKNLQEIQKTLPPDVKMNTEIFRQSDFIETAVHNVGRAILEGGILVIVILLLFLGNFRTTIISLLAIPLSLLGSIIVLNLLGMTINTMSLGGMAIAIGSLVDDAIIDVENVYKRLRQNRLKPKEERESDFDVVFHASSEIRSSIMNATLIIMATFLPLFFLSGMEGRMLHSLGISFLVSLLISLIVAMTLTPLLSKMLLTNENFLSKNEKDKWLVRNITQIYKRSLTWVLNHKKGVVGSVLALFIISVILFSRFGHSFLPEFNEGSLTIAVVTKPGTSLEESDNIGRLVEQELLSIPEVRSTCRRTGRGELDEHSQATNSAEIDVNFDVMERPQEEFLAEVREKLAQIPGIASSVGQPLGHRIDHMLSGTRANIAIKIFGTDLNKMYLVGEEIKQAVSGIDGLVDVSVDQQVEVPQLQIRANREKLAFYGISLETFNQYINYLLGGEKITDIYEGQCKYDLVVKLAGDYIHSIDEIKNALIDTHDGKKVPLEQVADIVSVSGPNSISRENVQRKIVVSANVAGGDLSGCVEQIEKNITEKVQLPEGYRIEYGGQFESAEKASKTLTLLAIAAVFVIFMLLYREFHNTKLASLVLLNLPLALIGGVFAIQFSSGILSIPSIIGFISLFGIATRNGLLLVSGYERLRNQGIAIDQIIIQGSCDRLNAILMTALTGALALIPMAINGDASGNEIQSPMAIVILGGLITSTILNIYIVPIIYVWLHKKLN